MTDRDRPDETLPELEELFNRLFLNLPVGAFVVQNRRFRLFNPQFQRLLGYSTEELLTMDCLDPVVTEDRDTVRENATRWLKGQRLSPYEYRFISRDGTTRWAMEAVIPGQYRGERAALGYFVDITEHKQWENAVQESEQRYRDLANSLPQIVFETDTEGMLTFANRNAFSSFGYARDDLTRGVNLTEMVAGEDRNRIRERMRRVLAGERPGPAEYTAHRKDGSTFPVRVYSSVIMRGDNPVGIRGIAVDVTEERHLRENMQSYISEITRAQEEERRRIARDLHDDTAQSLATLLLDIEKANRASDGRPEETRRILAQLRTRTHDILEGVRRFSQALRPDVLDQLGLLPSLELLTTELNQETTIRSRVEVIGTEQRLAEETELVLFRIAQEALRNARKHSQASEVTVTVDFSTRGVRLRVGDDGCGFSVPGETADLAGSSRLGLIGMRERARLVGGSLEIRSRPGEGTTITVEVGM